MPTKKIDPLGLLFPRRCPVCHEIVEETGGLVCEICRLKLPYIREPSCARCNKPLLEQEREYCLDCSRKKHQFEQGKAPFVYDKVMRSSIARYKYCRRQEYAAFYAEEILQRHAKKISMWKAEVLVPIPLHPSRRRKRGFNQAELLAKALSVRSGIPMDASLLIRTKKTHAQKELNDQERLANLKDAFSIQRRNIPYHNLILVDDIYTTGSTIDTAARLLKEYGVQKVYFLCICVGMGN